jgi:hypothetical protein
MRNSIVIKWYRVSQYDVVREFVHPDCAGDRGIIQGLTGQKTIDSRIRELVRDLTRGAVLWQEVVAPQVGEGSINRFARELHSGSGLLEGGLLDGGLFPHRD